MFYLKQRKNIQTVQQQQLALHFLLYNFILKGSGTVIWLRFFEVETKLQVHSQNTLPLLLIKVM